MTAMRVRVHDSVREAVERLVRERDGLRDVVRRLRDWSVSYGKDLCPADTEDTYGNGVRWCKQRVAGIVRTAPAAESQEACQCKQGRSHVLVARDCPLHGAAWPS